jgi:hypothetical protein
MIKILKKILNWTPTPQLNIIMNLVGLNLIISYCWNLFFKVIFFKYKKKQTLINHEQYDQLSKNGVLQIDNFLNEDDYIKLKNLIDEETKEKSSSSTDYSITLQTFNKINLRSNILTKYFGVNSELQKCIECLSGIKSKIQPPIEYRVIKNENKVLDHYDDQQDKLHKDVFYDSYKAIMYLNNVDKGNGAFIYALGTSSLTLGNIFYNYINAIVGIKSYEQVYKNLNKQSLEAKENSLIIMNASGLHQRGKFNMEGERKTLFIDFRYFHSLYNLKSLL